MLGAIMNDTERRLKTLEVDMAFLKRSVEKLLNQPNEVHYHYITNIDTLIHDNPDSFN